MGGAFEQRSLSSTRTTPQPNGLAVSADVWPGGYEQTGDRQAVNPGPQMFVKGCNVPFSQHCPEQAEIRVASYAS